MEKISLFSFSRKESGIIKGFAILMVLLGHTQYIAWGGGGGVGLFLILSGFGINESVKATGLSNYWCKRLKAVFIPYLFIAILNLLAFGIYRKLGLVCTLLGLDFSSNVDPTMWYISFIFFWYIVFFIVSVVTNKINNSLLKTIIKLLFLFLASFLCRYLAHLGVWHANATAGIYIWLFPIGVLFSEAVEIKTNNYVYSLFWGIALLAATAYIFKYYPSFSGKFWLAMPIQIISAVKLVNIKGKAERIFLWLGKYSYAIYLLEGIIVWSKRNIWFASLQNQVLIDFTSILITLLAAWVFWEGIYEKILKKIPLEKIIKI